MATEPVKKPFSAAHRVELVVVEAQVAVVEDWPLEEPSVVANPEVRFRYPLHIVNKFTHATQDPVPQSVAPRGNKPKGPRANTASRNLPTVVTIVSRLSRTLCVCSRKSS